MTPAPWRLQYLIEHFKALVGAGISVYTAFFAFGAVRFMPHNAFHPLLWAAPCTAGLAIIVFHWWKTRKLKKTAARVHAGPIRHRKAPDHGSDRPIRRLTVHMISLAQGASSAARQDGRRLNPAP